MRAWFGLVTGAFLVSTGCTSWGNFASPAETAAGNSAKVCSGIVTGITLTAAGTNYTSAPTVSISGAGGSGSAAVANLVPTSLATVTVTSGGSAYPYPFSGSVVASGGGGSGATFSVVGAYPIAGFTPVVTGNGCSPNNTYPVNFTGCGSGGTANITISGGFPAAPTLVAPGSYQCPPTVSFTGFTCTTMPNYNTQLGLGSIQTITVTASGSGYTAAPAIVISGGGGAGATASGALTPTGVGSVAVTAAGSGYTSAPTVTLSGGGGTGATATATINPCP